MGTPLRASMVIFVEELEVRPESIQVGIRIADLKLDVLGDTGSPLAGLLLAVWREDWLQGLFATLVLGGEAGPGGEDGLAERAQAGNSHGFHCRRYTTLCCVCCMRLIN